METKIGTINSKTENVGETNGKKWTRCVFNINGLDYSTFNKKFMEEFAVGDSVEIALEQKGEYWNLVDMKKIDNPNATEKVKVIKVGEDKKPKQQENDEVGKRICRMNCITNAVTIIDNARTKIIDTKAVIVLAKQLYEYAYNGI